VLLGLVDENALLRGTPSEIITLDMYEPRNFRFNALTESRVT
jgi:hypothetical protein